MNDSKTEQLETAIGRLQSQERRAAIDRGYIRSRLDPKQKAATSGGTLEIVAFTSFSGGAGDENVLAAFVYTFTDSVGTVHQNVAPSQSRERGTLFAGSHGIWDRTNNILFAVDERPIAQVCSTSPALLTTAPSPFFGF